MMMNNCTHTKHKKSFIVYSVTVRNISPAPFSTHSNGLLLDSPHGEDFARQGQLSRHGNVLTCWRVRGQGQQSRHYGATSTGPVFRSCSLGEKYRDNKSFSGDGTLVHGKKLNKEEAI